MVNRVQYGSQRSAENVAVVADSVAEVTKL